MAETAFLSFRNYCAKSHQADSSQYTTHFYQIPSILEDINNIVAFRPLSIDDLLAHYYFKPSGVRYILYKQAHKKHMCFFPKKMHYVDFAAYEDGGRLSSGSL